MALDALQDDAEATVALDDFERIGGWKSGQMNGAGDLEFADGFSARMAAMEKFQHAAFSEFEEF